MIEAIHHANTGESVSAAQAGNVIDISASLTKRPGYINIELHHSELQGKHTLVPDHDGNYRVLVDEEAPCFLFLGKNRMVMAASQKEGKEIGYRIYAGEHFRYELKKEGWAPLPVTLNNRSFDNVLIEFFIK